MRSALQSVSANVANNREHVSVFEDFKPVQINKISKINKFKTRSDVWDGGNGHEAAKPAKFNLLMMWARQRRELNTAQKRIAFARLANNSLAVKYGAPTQQALPPPQSLLPPPQSLPQVPTQAPTPARAPAQRQAPGRAAEQEEEEKPLVTPKKRRMQVNDENQYSNMSTNQSTYHETPPRHGARQDVTTPSSHTLKGQGMGGVGMGQDMGGVGQGQGQGQGMGTGGQGTGPRIRSILKPTPARSPFSPSPHGGSRNGGGAGVGEGGGESQGMGGMGQGVGQGQ
ncbi:hypothetical protein B484DRAFT_483680, partial [Ochromonadaceae sp. CCMP2298]